MPIAISTLEAIERDMEDNIYNFTKNGKCSGCGNCCTNLLPMSQKEVDTVHRYIKKNKIQECKHLLPVSTPTYDMTCPFRDNDNSVCTIYEVRPMVCRKFICDNEKRAKRDRDLMKQTRRIVDVRGEFFGR